MFGIDDGQALRYGWLKRPVQQQGEARMYANAVVAVSSDDSKPKDKSILVKVDEEVYSLSQDLPRGVRIDVMRTALEVYLELVSQGYPGAGEIMRDKRKLSAAMKLLTQARDL